MARRRPSGIADSPAARSVVGRTDIGYDSMVTAQFEGARRARLTLLVTLAVVTVLGVPAAITGRTGGTT